MFGLLLRFFSIAVILTTIAFLFWCAPRGFDFTDEGYYILSAAHPGDIIAWTQSAHWYSSGLYQLVGRSLTGVRILGFILLLGSSALLARGLAKFFPVFHAARHFVLPMVMAGALTHYFVYLPTPHYNWIVTVCMYASIGYLLLAAAEWKQREFASTTFLFLAGLCLGPVFFAKGPAFALLFLMLSLTWWVVAVDHPMRVFGGLFLFGLGSATWLLMHFVFIQSIPEFISQLQRGYEFAMGLGAGYGSAMFRRYRLELQAWFGAGAWLAGPCLVIVFGIRAAFQKLEKPATLLGIALVLCLVVFSVIVGINLRAENYFWPPLPAFFSATMILLAGCWLIVRPPWDKDLVIVALLLFFAPFAGAFGTDNPITANALFHMAPWYGLFFIALVSFGREWKLADLIAAGTAVLVFFSLSQVVLMLLTAPYRINGGIQAQTQATPLRTDNQSILLDAETHKGFKELQEIAQRCGFREGGDILAYASMPGVVFALGGRSPGFSWYFGSYPGAGVANEALLALVDEEKLKKAFVLMDSENEYVFTEATRKRLSFPSHYQECGKVILPGKQGWVRLWRPKH